MTESGSWWFKSAEYDGHARMKLDESPLQWPIGQHAWGVRLGEGSFLTLEFGPLALPSAQSHMPLQPRLRKLPDRGEWSLRVQHARWRLARLGSTLATSEQAKDDLRDAIKHLNDRVLWSVTTSGRASVVLHFNGELDLELSPYKDANYPDWTLFTPDGMAATEGGPKAELRVEPAFPTTTQFATRKLGIKNAEGSPQN